jgi:hypothetical protein
MIYFAQPIDGGPIKIGFSDDVDFRHRQLESIFGRKLAILATLPGGRKEEAEIHDQFSHLRFPRTEQFRPALELLTFIGQPVLIGINPDAVEAMKPRVTDRICASYQLPRDLVVKVKVEAARRGLKPCNLVEQLLTEGFGRHSLRTSSSSTDAN